ncbi:MAG: hypothetical protein M1816_008019 [Peltula sp. TS41687]|nr:MAG: hypothetical protein M1816_008019 [Peltula sp. TS41687]
MSRLASKVALVTGSSSGLGRAIARSFAAEGAKLVVCADLIPHIYSDEAEEPTHELICREFGPGRAVFVKTDVTIAAEVEAAVKEAVDKGEGKLHILVNNAGILTGSTLIHELSEEKFEAVMRVNTHGTFLGCKYACAQFLKQEVDSNGHRGWIINIASIAGLTGIKGAKDNIDDGVDNIAAYCASKAAVVNLTRTVAIDYAEHKIHVNALCPGFLRTPMTKDYFDYGEINTLLKASTPWWNDGNVWDVARVAVFLASEDAAWITGVAFPVDGGYLAKA